MSKARRRTVKALVVLGSILAFLSVFAIWTERQALNTDDWVDTSGRLIEDQTIRAALADYLVDQLYEHVDVEKELKGLLPEDFKNLAGAASGGLRQVAGQGAEEVLKTSTAQALWRDANRLAHEELLAVLEDEKEAISTREGKVTLKLGTLVTNLANEVGIGAQLADKLPADAGEITILRSDELKTAQDVALAIKGLALVLSLLTFLAFGLAIYLSGGNRWVTVLTSGIGLVAAGFAVIVVREIAGGIVVDQLVSEESVKPAAEQAWSISTSLMVSIATSVIVIGVFFGIAGWLGSPTGSARASRRFISPLLRDYPAYVYSGLAVLVCLYFLFAPTQNLRSLLTTLVIAGLAAFGVHELRRQTEEEFPDTSFDDVFGGARARVSGAVKSANLSEKAAKLRLPEVRRPGGEEGLGDEEAGAPTAAPSAARHAEAPPTSATPTPAPPAADGLDAKIARLERLGNLRDKGVLSDEEFEAEKRRVMGRD